ncbi:MAG TPA: hypothetical protein H9857_11185, partial [Candidatus Desulfovibrio intestinigallinarum]|nr:hypothetical protein [Candidatus Desulfovibrio intestinigallinarum]
PSPARFFRRMQERAIVWSDSSLKKVNREAASQRRPALSERKKFRFFVKRQAVWFEMDSISN